MAQALVDEVALPTVASESSSEKQLSKNARRRGSGSRSDASLMDDDADVSSSQTSGAESGAGINANEKEDLDNTLLWSGPRTQDRDKSKASDASIGNDVDDSRYGLHGFSTRG